MSVDLSKTKFPACSRCHLSISIFPVIKRPAPPWLHLLKIDISASVGLFLESPRASERPDLTIVSCLRYLENNLRGKEKIYYSGQA